MSFIIGVTVDGVKVLLPVAKVIAIAEHPDGGVSVVMENNLTYRLSAPFEHLQTCLSNGTLLYTP